MKPNHAHPWVEEKFAQEPRLSDALRSPVVLFVAFCLFITLLLELVWWLT